MAIYKIWPNIFPAVIAGNLPENRIFGIFSRFHHYFLNFCTKMRISNAQKYFRNFLKIAGNRRLYRFSFNLFLIYFLFFPVPIPFLFYFHFTFLFPFYIYHQVGPICNVLVFLRFWVDAYLFWSLGYYLFNSYVLLLASLMNATFLWIFVIWQGQSFLFKVKSRPF